ncbi:Serine/threonine-protein phosphatase 1 [Rubripirellula lacrimiformis]|uniref:Serine/threonine-protein phosphatase 1 n=1 Tax=Rubripirellula lacrimiformis TaxID=1930273 RepID=A0A517NI97_9BACT|nr:metallophosphoesterase family protein [Rubripirellula lacrimiformis]QDT06851.1 Serine/threonine-protein phosphatase 1 [Rubripirellula lacrimiformis]
MFLALFGGDINLSGRLLAIGDIHGCRTALEKLLEAIAPTPDDIVVTLGDYVDRGPDSRGVIDTLIDLGRRTRLVGLLGNHEEMMLSVVREGESHHSWLRHGGVETLDSYGFDGDLDFLPAEHEAFFDSLGDYFEHGDYFFTHAAYDPDTPLEQQPADLLRWYSLTEGLPARHRSGKTAVVGHTANRDGEVLDIGHLLCIDTYCYGGGWLTAVDLGNRQYWQVSEAGVLR